MLFLLLTTNDDEVAEDNIRLLLLCVLLLIPKWHCICSRMIKNSSGILVIVGGWCSLGFLLPKKKWKIGDRKG